MENLRWDEHYIEYHGQFNWIKSKALSAEQYYHKQKNQKVVRNQKAKTNKDRKVLNCDEGNLVKTSTWNPLFVKPIEKESN